jgi:hypothetical protein
VARYEKDLDALGAEPLSVPQVLALLEPTHGDGSARTAAVARFLAGAEGWEEAAAKLGGAFADCDGVRIDSPPPRVNR